MRLFIVVRQVADLFGGVFVEQSSEFIGDGVGAKQDLRVGLDDVLVFDAVADV